MARENTTFSISPGTGMIDVLGHSGYTFNYAIADLIDNCISAHAKNIDLYFDLSSEKPYLYILDDGIGMSLEDLKNAAIIGYKDIDSTRSVDDLGRYSTGLKSATRSFCDDIFISSKKEGCEANTIEIDYAHITESKKWEAFIVESPDFESRLKNHGTIVVCNKLHFIDNVSLNKTAFEKIESLEKSISHIFGKFLLSNEISITVQVKGSIPNAIKGWNPFGLIENKSTKVVYNNIVKYKNESLKFKAYILPAFSNLSKVDQQYMFGSGLLDQEGFYIYRNKRLIKEGGWLGLDNLDDKSKYARIEVEIPSALDKEFKINFSKNSIEIPEDLKSIFAEVAKVARKESHNNFDYLNHPGTKRTTKKEEERIWKTSKSNGALVLSINMQHPLIQELSSKLTDNELKKLCNLISKSLPVSMIQGQNTTTISYTENELEDMMNKMYEKLMRDIGNANEVKKKMSSMEPFKNNKSLLIDFFDMKERQQ